MTEPDLFVCKEPVTFEYEGVPVFLGPTTVVRAGHPIMKGREYLFEPLRVHFDLPERPAEQSTTKRAERADRTGGRA